MQLHNYSMRNSGDARSIPLRPRAIERLEEVGVPTLVLIGEKDLPFFQELAGRIQSRIPGAALHRVQGVAHLISLEAPEEFDSAVSDFLGRR